jgi:hypothetical protein
MSAAYRGLRAYGLRGNRSLLPRKTDDTVDGRRRNGERAATRWRCRGWAVVLIQGEAPAAPGAVPRSGGAGSGTWSLLRLSRAHFVEREREPVGAIAVSKCDMPAQFANESFRADHVRLGNSVGAVVQVLMRSDIPAAEAFFRDHLRTSPYRSEISAAMRSGVQDDAGGSHRSGRRSRGGSEGLYHLSGRPRADQLPGADISEHRGL